MLTRCPNPRSSANQPLILPPNRLAWKRRPYCVAAIPHVLVIPSQDVSNRLLGSGLDAVTASRYVPPPESGSLACKAA